MAARKFTSSTTVEYKVATTVDILLVGGGAGGNSTSGGNPGILILHLNYTLLPGTYDVIVGSGGAPNMDGSDTFFGDSLFMAQGGRILATEQGARKNVVNGIFLAPPVVASPSFVVADNSRNFEEGVGTLQIAIPPPVLPPSSYEVPNFFDLCTELDVCGIPLAQRGRSAASGGLGAFAIPNTGSGGDGGFFAGRGGSGLVVIRNLREAENPMNCSLLSDSMYQACYSSCMGQEIDIVVRTPAPSTVLLPFTADVLVDILMVGGGAGGTNTTSGGAGVIVLYRSYLLRKGTYILTVGNGGAWNAHGANTTISSSSPPFLLTARGGRTTSGTAAANYSLVTYNSAETIGANGTSNVTLAAGDNVNFCAMFPGLFITTACPLLGARMSSGNAPSNSGSGGGSRSSGGSGVIAVRNSFPSAMMMPMCRSMCREQCLANRTSSVCGPGQFFSSSTRTCTDCPRNTYRDMTTDSCITCQKGFVTSATVNAASSSLACKSWCLAPFRKETGVIRVDTFPKPYNGTTNVTASTAAAALTKIVMG